MIVSNVFRLTFVIFFALLILLAYSASMTFSSSILVSAANPSAFASLNNFSDPADLEQYLESHAGKLLEYAKRNKDSILSALKGIPSPSVPTASVEPDQPVEPVKSV